MSPGPKRWERAVRITVNTEKTLFDVRSFAAHGHIHPTERLNNSGKRTLLYPETTVTLTDGYTEDIVLTQNCVSFIGLIPVS